MYDYVQLYPVLSNEQNERVRLAHVTLSHISRHEQLVYVVITAPSFHAFQQEQRHAVREDILHARAVNAALHGRIGKAAVLEVCLYA